MQALSAEQLTQLVVRQLRLVAADDPWAQDPKFLLEVRRALGLWHGQGVRGAPGCFAPRRRACACRGDEAMVRTSGGGRSAAMLTGTC